ncbi:MAG: serine/threonine protein kinase [Bryobacterales bacterium]|nr:serine/threonine protein kinase [Bryobacterales bacterium]
MTGRTIGHYRMIDKLGEGGMGKVYRAVDVMVDREVALKSLKADLAARPEVVERFRTEATTLAKLNHPNVAQLYSFFKDGNEYFMVMEYVPGRTLEQAIQHGGPMPWRQALEVAAQVLEGIQHAHQLGILHRDIKPANIILPDSRKSTGGFQPVAKITDFGIAQALGSARMTREGHLIGTLEYIAPERIQGKGAGAQSDLYSMAVVLYEMLSGRLPFQAESEYSLLLAQVQLPPPRLRNWLVDVPPAVESTVMRGLEKVPEKRFPDAASFAAALRAHLSSAATSDVNQAAPGTGLSRVVYEAGSAFRAILTGATNSANPQSASGTSGELKTAQVVFYSCIALVVMLALASVVVVGIARLTRPATVPEVANLEEPAPSTAPSPPAAEPVPEISFEPGVPIPIGQILGGVNRDTETNPPATPPGTEHETPESTQPAVAVPQVVARPKPRMTGSGLEPVSIPASDRTTVLAALDLSDGPTEGRLGEWPVHRAGLSRSLRLSQGHWLADIAQAVERRGVNFLLTPSIQTELMSAGADQRVLQAVANGLRSTPKPGASLEDQVVATKAVEVKPKPVAASHLRDVRRLYLEKMPGNLDTMLRAELQRELKGIITITQSASSADARMTASEEESQGGLLAGAGRLMGLKDKYRLQVRIVSTAAARELWSFETGDRSAITATHGSRAMQRAVSKVSSQLRRAMQ